MPFFFFFKSEIRNRNTTWDLLPGRMGHNSEYYALDNSSSDCKLKVLTFEFKQVTFAAKSAIKRSSKMVLSLRPIHFPLKRKPNSEYNSLITYSLIKSMPEL